MSNAFFEDIKGLNSWGEVFQSIPAFEKLIRRIFGQEGLGCQEISNLTAGSNAVFKVDNFVVKIFAPTESGMNTESDYARELLGMKRAMNLGISVPNVRAASSIEDKYLFRYIIMDYINGKDARGVLNHYSTGEKIEFVRQIKENITKMNTVVEVQFSDVDVRAKALVNTRWNVLSNEVVTQIRDLIGRHEMSNQVYVHGDLTGDNVRITQDGRLYLLDFADGKIAPREYEFGPILFDLFDFDKVMIDELIGSQNIEEFAEKCFYGLLLHDFGSHFVKLICQRVMGIGVSDLTDILQVKEALVRLFSK